MMHASNPSTLTRQRREDLCESKASCGYIIRLKKKKNVKYAPFKRYNKYEITIATTSKELHYKGLFISIPHFSTLLHSFRAQLVLS